MNSSDAHDQSIDLQEISFSDSMTPHSTNLSDKIITQEKVVLSVTKIDDLQSNHDAFLSYDHSDFHSPLHFFDSDILNSFNVCHGRRNENMLFNAPF